MVTDQRGKNYIWGRKSLALFCLRGGEEKEEDGNIFKKNNLFWKS